MDFSEQKQRYADALALPTPEHTMRALIHCGRIETVEYLQEHIPSTGIDDFLQKVKAVMLDIYHHEILTTD